VEGEAGEFTGRHAGHPEVLHDDPVRPHAREVLEELVDAVRLPFLEDRVDGGVELLALAVEGLHRGFELGKGEVGGAQARVEGLEPQVDGVGASPMAASKASGLPAGARSSLCFTVGV
jgi:hypothetical protein